jgi:primase-polymerase (primpol)-like protein
VATPTRKASSTDPATWATFEDARDAYAALGSVDGIGVVLTRGSGITCIDLDRVIDGEGRLDARAETIVERCNSWTEISPSRSGLHIFVRGAVPEPLKGDQIEVYSEARYIAVTGHRWPGTSDRIIDQQGYLAHLVRLKREGDHPRQPYTGPRVPPPDDLVHRIMNSFRVSRMRPAGGADRILP